jgi:hypothetical protein
VFDLTLSRGTLTDAVATFLQPLYTAITTDVGALAVDGALAVGVPRPRAYGADPRACTNTVAFAGPYRYPQGMHPVVVNGRCVVWEGEQTTQRRGRILGR